MYNDEAFTILAIFGAFLIFFLIIGVVLYVIASLGLYRLALNAKMDNPWMAWIPFANLYVLAKLAGEIQIGSLKVPSNEIVLPVGAVIVAFINQIPFIGFLCSIAYTILFCFTLFRLYKNYRPDSAVLWLVLSIILPFMGPIFLFVMRNDEPAL